MINRYTFKSLLLLNIHVCLWYLDSTVTSFWHSIFAKVIYITDLSCGLVVRVPGYRSRGLGFDSQRYQIFGEVVGLWVQLRSYLEQIVSGSGLENREYCRWDSLRWTSDTLYYQKFALNSPTIGGHSVGIVRLRTKATEFVLSILRMHNAKKFKIISKPIKHNRSHQTPLILYYVYNLRLKSIRVVVLWTATNILW
jgi:hypothetical protein